MHNEDKFITRISAEGYEVNYEYSGIYLTGVTSINNETEHFTYHPHGKMAKKITALGLELSFEYYDNLKIKTLGNGEYQTTFTYEPDRTHLTGLCGNTRTYVFNEVIQAF